MRAILHERYGPPAEVLSVGEAPTPEPAPDEVLVRVRAASLHPDIWHAVVGQPYALRLMGNGLRRPKLPVPGTDLAGVVEAVGDAVTAFAPGDAVLGEVLRGHQWKHGGTFAELAVAPAENLCLKPSSLSFVEAAAVPTSGAIAVQVVRDEAQLAEGQRVLINGAGGSVGTFAVQLATLAGAEVTAVDRATKLAMLREIGADEVIDFEREDPRAVTTPYDAVIDIASTFTVRDLKRILRPDGRYVLVGHDHYGAGAGRWIGSIGRFVRLLALAPFVPRLRSLATFPDTRDGLEVVCRHIEAGELSPVVGETFPLAEVVAGLDRLAAGGVGGKIVLEV